MTMEDREMTGRAVIVTGGAGGVGRTVSLRWLEAGASVLVADYSQAALDQLREALPREVTDRVVTVAADLTTEAGATHAVAEAAKAFGRPADTLIHLVGGFAMGPLEAPDAARTWDRMMAVNLTSAFQCYRAI